MRLTFRQPVIDQISECKFNHRAPPRGVLESTFVCRMGAWSRLSARNCDALTTPRGDLSRAVTVLRRPRRSDVPQFRGMLRRYVTVDVFTARVFGGNPLAVVLDAQGLSAQQMQSAASEFNYAETTFVLPPREPGRTAHVRIFTPRTEVPFAGHPNVGTTWAARACCSGARKSAAEWSARFTSAVERCPSCGARSICSGIAEP